MVEGERVLKAVGGWVPMCPEPADVVDQHVQSRVGVEDGGGEPPYLGLGAHVGGERVDGRVSRTGTDVGRGLLGARGVAARDADPGADGGKADRGGLADSPGAAGDQDDLVGHGERVSRGPRLRR